MRRFRVSGTFLALDIDDALDWLGHHFTYAASGENPDYDRSQFIRVELDTEPEAESATTRAEQS